MATENAVMAAALAPGETVIGNAACEPHVQDLCRFLVSLGARHRRASASNVLRDPRRRVACAAASTRSRPTTSRSASFIGLAAITGGDITIEDAAPRGPRLDPAGFARLGIRVELEGDDACACPPEQEL